MSITTKYPRCFIRSLNAIHRSIEIPEEPKPLGRSAETAITNLFCSRKQLTMEFNKKDLCVLAKVIGTCESGLNGFKMLRDKVYQCLEGDIVEIVRGESYHKIEIEHGDANAADCTKNESSVQENLKKSPEQNTKRTYSEDDANSSAKRIKLEENPDPKPIPNMQSRWDSIDSGNLLVFTQKGVLAASKIASYDIDGTIIKTKSGNVFPKTTDDWQIAFPEVPGILKTHFGYGSKIVFFTNQAGISSGKLKENDLKRKIESIVAKLNIPIQVFVSTGKGKYRKPMLGMWDCLVNSKNCNVTIDKATSFYVGDAAGRPECKSLKRRKDHSMADRLFARNAGIQFFTPEEHFKNIKREKFMELEYDPTKQTVLKLLEPASSPLHKSSDFVEVIVMVGGPGSGKSSFARQHLESIGYTLINRDKLKTWQKCVDVLKNCLQKKQKAVIDNTNPDEESRRRFTQVAKSMAVPCRCFVMTTAFQHTRHNIRFRELTDPNHVAVNDMVLNTYRKKYKEPTLAEGFAAIVKVNFVPNFQNKEHQELYKMYLLEK